MVRLRPVGRPYGSLYGLFYGIGRKRWKAIVEVSGLT